MRQFNSSQTSNQIPSQSTANDKQQAPIQQDCANGVPASWSTSPSLIPCSTATALYSTKMVPKIHFDAKNVKKYHQYINYQTIKFASKHGCQLFFVTTWQPRKFYCQFVKNIKPQYAKTAQITYKLISQTIVYYAKKCGQIGTNNLK